jgi:hypothetical protein
MVSHRSFGEFASRQRRHAASQIIDLKEWHDSRAIVPVLRTEWFRRPEPYSLGLGQSNCGI